MNVGQQLQQNLSSCLAHYEEAENRDYQPSQGNIIIRELETQVYVCDPIHVVDSYN